MNYMTMQYENIVTILLAVIGFGITVFAQIRINSAYAKYKVTTCKKKLTGCEVARKILDENHLENVHVVEVSGTLTDHYDSGRKVVRLSKEVFHGDSIASISVAAHECGHAIQDKENYSFLRIRASLVPLVSFINYAGYFVMIVSLFAGMTNYLVFGILMILTTLVFQLVTLPVEFDASNKAKEQLLTLNLVEEEEQEGVKEMLKTAAMTYVAGVLSSILNLLRLIIMFQDKDE